MSLRHSRKRSSVSIKKRVEPIQQSNTQTLGSPYPEDNGVEFQRSTETPKQPDIGDQTMIMSSPEPICHLDQSDNMITRSEANLFDDDDELVMSEIPKVKAGNTSRSNSPSVRVLAHIPNGESVRYSEAQKKSPQGSPLSSTSVEGKNRDGVKQKPLISNNSSANGSVRSAFHKAPLLASPSKSHFQSSPIRRIPVRGKRMSLNYIASPATPRLIEVDRSATTNDSSSIGTPATSVATSSHTGYFPRQDAGSITGRMAVPSSANSNRSCSVNSTSPTLSRMGKREDGDTVMNQHKDILERIAEKERRVFELKEILTKEEKELKELQNLWQTNVNQGLALHQPRSSETNDEKGNGTDSEIRGKEMYQQASLVTADGWKVFSATLAGAGTQINAFIDQLAPPPIEAVKRSDTGKARSVKVEALREGSNAPPKTPLKIDNLTKKAAESSQSDKRTSMFGVSMAAIQKQVDALSGVDGSNDSTPRAAGVDSNTGWGTWQKRLKEARENASGLLAKAEQRLGQALVMEDTIKATTSSVKGVSSSDADKTHQRTESSSVYIFGAENDREKAALAELTWLNSLAGVNMSGTTDRVTTSLPAENPKKKRNSIKSSNTSKESNRRSSVVSQSSNSSKVKEEVSSPRQSLSNESDSTRKSGESSGSFSLLSTALSIGDTESVATDDKESRRKSGQNKIQNASLTDVREKEEILRDSRLMNSHSMKPATQDSRNLVKLVEASEEQDDDVAWGL